MNLSIEIDYNEGSGLPWVILEKMVGLVVDLELAPGASYPTDFLEIVRVDDPADEFVVVKEVGPDPNGDADLKWEIPLNAIRRIKVEV